MQTLHGTQGICVQSCHAFAGECCLYSVGDAVMIARIWDLEQKNA
jgi:hypothetical protein